MREMLIEELAKGVDAALRTTVDDAIAGTRQRLTQLLGVSVIDGACCAVAGSWLTAPPGTIWHDDMSSMLRCPIYVQLLGLNGADRACCSGRVVAESILGHNAVRCCVRNAAVPCSSWGSAGAKK